MTLTNFLQHVADALAYNTDAGLGDVNTDNLWNKQQVAHLNRAMMLYYQPGAFTYMLPHATTSGNLTVSSNVVTFASTATSPMLTLWAADPRLTPNALPVRYIVERAHDKWIVYGSPAGTCYGFWIAAPTTYSTASMSAVVPDDLVPVLLNAVLDYNGQSRPAPGPNYKLMAEEALTNLDYRWHFSGIPVWMKP